MEKADRWDEEPIEAWEHNEWLLMQELGSDYYKLHRSYNSEGKNEYQAMRTIVCKEEEEKAKRE